MRIIKIFRETFLIFLRCLLMGTADVIPGVSGGGAMALITGIYPGLIHAISQINLTFLFFALEGKLGKAQEEVKSGTSTCLYLYWPVLGGCKVIGC
ncbi:MAG: hypothetical protein BME94_04355 [Methanobacteriales archaeon Met13]